MRPGGRLAFVTIQPMPGLSARRRRRANAVGPPAGAVRTSYESMLHTAGFVDITAEDRTAEYRSTQAGWLAAVDAREVAIRAMVGDEEYDTRRQNRLATAAAIDDGLLGRFLYTATRG